jgi:hypothetical protein
LLRENTSAIGNVSVLVACRQTLENVPAESPAICALKKEETLADNTRERARAEAQFKKTQKQTEGGGAKAAYVTEADAVRAKTARLRELRLAKEAADKARSSGPSSF